MAERIKNRALWWQYPSMTDVPVGPWSAHLPHTNENVIQHWKLAIDWMADLEVNVFIGSLVSFLKGPGQGQISNWRVFMADWPFPAVCKWEKYPYAQVYPDRFIKENRKNINILLEYFHKKGIKTYLHHYNYFAPYEWWRRQPSLINKRVNPEIKLEDQGLFPSLEYDPVPLAKNVCPNEPLYQEFMRDSWKELFTHLPELDGLLITLGENRRCPCEECTGGLGEFGTAFSTNSLRTHTKFAEMYKDTLLKLKKEPMIRCWHGGGDKEYAKAMPKGLTYLIKYSGFNSIDCGPDPVYRFWKNEGHRLWAVHEVSGAESGGPFTWINPEWVYKVSERAKKKMAIEGEVAFHNEYLGRVGHTYPGMTINMESALRAFNGEEYDNKLWEKRCIERLGPNGAIYFKAGKLYSQIALNIDKVVSGPTDGVAFCVNYYFTGPPDHPLVIGGLPGTEPHPWIRDNVAVLRQYEEYLKDNPWCKDILSKAIKPGQIDPVSFLKDKWEKAKEGLSLIEKIKISPEDPTYTTHQVMLLSARWAVEVAKFWFSIVWAKIIYYGVKSPVTPFSQKPKLAKECLKNLDEVVNAVWEMNALYYQFPPRYFDWGKGLNTKPIELKLAHYKKERDKVREEFSPLLEGKLFFLSEYKYWAQE